MMEAHPNTFRAGPAAAHPTPSSPRRTLASSAPVGVGAPLRVTRPTGLGMRVLQRGSLLIVTLAVVIILGALAVAIGRYLSLELRVTKYRAAREQAQTLARGGVYLAMALIQQDQTAVDWAGEDWATTQAASPVTGHRLTVSVTDEERKLNINAATKDQLERLTGSAELAQAIVDYVDPADPAEDQPAGTPPYFAKNGPVDVLEELTDLPTMDEDLYAVLAEQATPYTPANSRLNINTATPEVLRAVGLSDSAIGHITAFRDGPDGPAAHEEDGVFEEAGQRIIDTLEQHQQVVLDAGDRTVLSNSSVFGISSQTFLVVAEASLERPRSRVRIDAVVQRGSSGEAPRVIAWREG